MQRGSSISHSCTANESCSLGFDMKQLRKCTDRSKKYYTTVMHYVTPFVATRDYVTYVQIYTYSSSCDSFISSDYIAAVPARQRDIYLSLTAIINVSTTYRFTRTTSRIA